MLWRVLWYEIWDGFICLTESKMGMPCFHDIWCWCVFMLWIPPDFIIFHSYRPNNFQEILTLPEYFHWFTSKVWSNLYKSPGICNSTTIGDFWEFSLFANISRKCGLKFTNMFEFYFIYYKSQRCIKSCWKFTELNLHCDITFDQYNFYC